MNGPGAPVESKEARRGTSLWEEAFIEAERQERSQLPLTTTLLGGGQLFSDARGQEFNTSTAPPPPKILHTQPSPSPPT